MTSKLTRDELNEVVSTYGKSHIAHRMAVELLAAMDSEPVAWTWHYREQWHVTNDEERARDLTWDGIKVEPLYRHAQPAPVVPDESYQQLSELYHAQEKRLFKIAQRIKGPTFDKYSHTPSQALDVLEAVIFGEDDACRAAMLQELQKSAGAEATCRSNENVQDLQVDNSPVIPDGYVMVPKEPTEAMINAWLSEVANWRGHVAGYKAMLAAAPQDVPALNSVQSVATVPGGWIPVSERMPKMGEHQCYVLAADFKNHYWPNIPNTQVGVYGDWFGDGNPAWDDGDGEDLHLKEVTHWMPLPAAPQEVK